MTIPSEQNKRVKKPSDYTDYLRVSLVAPILECSVKSFTDGWHFLHMYFHLKDRCPHGGQA
jgi:hypothetical protein